LLFYRVRLDIPRELMLFVSWAAAGPPPRERHPERHPQAGLSPAGAFALAWFRDKGTTGASRPVTGVQRHARGAEQ
jgi:hypothetical protein